ncbi:MAG: NAD(P)-binding domain-containing protein [Myxococcota bacterium]|nr:NAD(P)-binding domain-containing protein [Myxococcota bacterium]
MATIAVLGMGLLGRGFAENLLAKGHTVRVWNRTASRCAPLAEQGAIVGATPEETVRGAERVHLVLAEDTAVDAVLDALRPGLAKDAFVVDHSTNLPAGVAARFARLRAEGVRYVHAPVFMGPSNSRAGTGLMLLSAPADDELALRPLLEQMTGRVVHVGVEPDKAAKLKLAGNGMLILLTAAMGDLFRMGQASGVTTDEILALFDQFSPTASGMGRRALSSGTQPVGFELSMARKDVRLMLETAGAAHLTLLPAVAAAMDAAIEAGRGAEDFAAIADPTR